MQIDLLFSCSYVHESLPRTSDSTILHVRGRFLAKMLMKGQNWPSTESVLAHCRLQVSLETTKNANTTLTLTASDWNGTNKTQQAMYVRKYVLIF